MEIIVEVVAARAERRQADDDRLARRHRNFAVELEAFEFDRLVAGIVDSNGERLTRRNIQSLWREVMTGKLDRGDTVAGSSVLSCQQRQER